jgi:penicillin-binding protein 2
MTMALANGGIIYKPRLFDKIMDTEGAVISSFEPVVVGEMKGMEKNLALIRKGLVGAVNDKRGTGRKAKLEGITVGGKTGTAQVVRLEKFEETDEEDVPYKYRDHAWFTSFAPAEDPEIAVTVLVEHGGHGGAIAAPIAKKVLERYFSGRLETEKEENSNNQASLD